MVEHGNIQWGGTWEGERMNRGMMASQLFRYISPKIEVMPLFHPKNGIMPLFQLEIICYSFFIFPLQLFYNASDFSLLPQASPTHAEKRYSRRFATMVFSATQRWLLQFDWLQLCSTVLRLKSSRVSSRAEITLGLLRCFCGGAVQAFVLSIHRLGQKLYSNGSRLFAVQYKALQNMDCSSFVFAYYWHLIKYYRQFSLSMWATTLVSRPVNRF